MPSFDFEGRLDRAEQTPLGTAARVLSGAEALFAQRGFDGVRTRDIAAAAGVNVATLHFHWKDKRTLYEAVCRLHARLLLDAVTRAAAPDDEPARPPAELVSRWVDQAIELLVARPAIAPLALQSVSGQAPPDLPTLFAHDVSSFRSFAGVLEQTADAESPDGDPMLLLLSMFYFAIVAFSDSTLQQALLDGSVRDDARVQERVARFAKSLLLAMLGARKQLP